MLHYILKRLLLIIPTLFGIMLINFIVVQFTPGGPVERTLAALTLGQQADATATFSGAGGDGGISPSSDSSKDYTIHGYDPEIVKKIEKEFGFDKPASERFINMILSYLKFDFGESFYRSIPVTDLILEKLPVSISLGLWTMLISYLISIPLGIKKAVRDGSPFDIWTSAVIIVSYAIPGFLFAILMIVMFAGGSYWQIFPLRGLISDNWSLLPWYKQILDYIWHLTLPVLSMAISGFATLTLLTKNSMTEELRKQYVITAKMKGLSEHKVLYSHVVRNAMLLVISGFPSAFVGIFLTGSLIVETLFSLDGLGLLGFESIVNRDYPVVFGTLYIFSLVGLLVNIVSDIVYVIIDPRINFNSRSL